MRHPISGQQASPVSKVRVHRKERIKSLTVHCFRLSPQDPDNGVNVWPLLLFTGADEFSNFPSVQECDRQVSGLMRTACLTPSSKAKDLDELLETKGPWLEFSEGSLILWRKPAPLSELEEEENQELASGEQLPTCLPPI